MCASSPHRSFAIIPKSCGRSRSAWCSPPRTRTWCRPSGWMPSPPVRSRRGFGWRLRGGRARRAGLPGREFPARSRGGAPQHLGGLGTGDQDQRPHFPGVEHLPDPSRPHRQRGCRVLQREGPDLMFLDQPGDISDLDRRLYQRLGLRPEPFSSVECWAPYKANGVNLNTLRTHPSLTPNTNPLVWGLREVLDYAEVLLNRDDIDAKADAFIDFLAERVVGRNSRTARSATRPSWSKLCRSGGVLPRHLRFRRCRARRRSLAHPITSPRSGRCETGSATSARSRAW